MRASPTALIAARAVFVRELSRSLRRRGQLVQPLIFFALVASLFPFALGPDPTTLARLAPGIVWVSVLLATTLSLDEIFRADYEDGSLELFALSPHPLPLLVLMKWLAHWLLTAWPLIVCALPLGGLLGLAPGPCAVLALTLALGTPVLGLIGGLASALTVGLRGGALLLALLTLPLYIPILIFGAAAAQHAALGLSAVAELYFLAGLAMLALTLAPFGTAAALRARLG